MIRLYDIEWDTDGEEWDLPKEVIIEKPSKDLIEAVYTYDDKLADYLSDTYGFCLHSFKSEELNIDERYSFKAIWEIGNWFRRHPTQRKTLEFTLDSPSEVTGNTWEPTGWYGIKITDDFDVTNVLIGEYGIGLLWYDDPVENLGETIENSLINFIKNEEGIKNIDKWHYITVDLKVWED